MNFIRNFQEEVNRMFGFKTKEESAILADYNKIGENNEHN